jgi:hypothetical protein
MFGNPGAVQSAPVSDRRSQSYATLNCINELLTIMQAPPQHFLLFDAIFRPQPE